MPIYYFMLHFCLPWTCSNLVLIVMKGLLYWGSLIPRKKGDKRKNYNFRFASLKSAEIWIQLFKLNWIEKLLIMPQPYFLFAIGEENRADAAARICELAREPSDKFPGEKNIWNGCDKRPTDWLKLGCKSSYLFRNLSRTELDVLISRDISHLVSICALVALIWNILSYFTLFIMDCFSLIQFFNTDNL